MSLQLGGQTRAESDDGIGSVVVEQVTFADGTSMRTAATGGGGSGGPSSTSELVEGSNLYFTDARAKIAIESEAIQLADNSTMGSATRRLATYENASGSNTGKFLTHDGTIMKLSSHSMATEIVNVVEAAALDLKHDCTLNNSGFVAINQANSILLPATSGQGNKMVTVDPLGTGLQYTDIRQVPQATAANSGQVLTVDTIDYEPKWMTPQSSQGFSASNRLNPEFIDAAGDTVTAEEFAQLGGVTSTMGGLQGQIGGLQAQIDAKVSQGLPSGLADGDYFLGTNKTGLLSAPFEPKTATQMGIRQVPETSALDAGKVLTVVEEESLDNHPTYSAVWRLPPPKIAFSARRITNSKGTEASSVNFAIPCKFDRVDYNINSGGAIGSGYVNTGDCHFVAPVAGVYRFYLRAMFRINANFGNARVELQIRKSDNFNTLDDYGGQAAIVAATAALPIDFQAGSTIVNADAPRRETSREVETQLNLREGEMVRPTWITNDSATDLVVQIAPFGGNPDDYFADPRYQEFSGCLLFETD